jgi:hypothetical protein
MIIICTSSADTYITNKIINNSFRAVDANVGQAATIDLFKLYGETKLLGSGSQTEISRGLLKFDLAPIKTLTSSIIDINSDNFKAYLDVKNLMTGHAIPTNFTISVFPLSQSFDEGEGLDISKFDDIHVANFVTASYTTQNNVWFSTGSNAGGLLGSNDIDYITSGNLNDGLGVTDFECKQNFFLGNEDLFVEVTRLVSATISNQIPDVGFRISFTGSQETDTKTRFVKRFASRHVANPLLRPKIYVTFDDSIEDNHKNFTFDSTGSVYINSFNKSSFSNLVSGSSITPITGQNCLIYHLNYGLFDFYVTGSQRTAGTNNSNVAGQYCATFALSSQEQSQYAKTKSIAQLVSQKGEVKFNTYWKSLDGTVVFNSGTLTVKKIETNNGSFISREPQLVIMNSERKFNKKDNVRFRIFGRDLLNENNLPVKRPYSLDTVIYNNVYYQVVDRITGKIIIPYDSVNNGTKVSTDSDGMFFDFRMQSLYVGRSYAFDFYIVERGMSYLIQNRDVIFEVSE